MYAQLISLAAGPALSSFFGMAESLVSDKSKRGGGAGAAEGMSPGSPLQNMPGLAGPGVLPGATPGGGAPGGASSPVGSILDSVAQMLSKILPALGDLVAGAMKGTGTADAPTSPSAETPGVAGSGSVSGKACPGGAGGAKGAEGAQGDAPAARPLGRHRDFLWKPTSEKDKNLVILTPSKMAGEVTSVKVLSPDGSRVLGTGKNTGIANGGRDHFRFSKTGGSYPDGSLVEIRTKAGNVFTVTVGETARRMTR